jgi:hypothetical protein
MSRFRTFVLPAAAALMIATPALADRDPTPDERTAIEAQLQSLGFTSWDDIEFDEDDNYWEVDDARGEDGVQYDLKLAPETFEVLEQRED